MALTLQKLQDLEEAGLVDLLESKQDLFGRMAEHAFDYTKEFVTRTGEDVRQDDVLPVLTPVLEVCEPLRDHLAERHLRQKYWYERFGELLIDRLWPELIKR